MNWRRVMFDACLRKRCYRSDDEARVALGRDLKLRVYRCPFNREHWHLGHPPKMKTVRKVASAIRARAQDPTA